MSPSGRSRNEPQALAALFKSAVAGVEDERAAYQLVGLLFVLVQTQPAHEGIHPGGELCGGEGLGNVVVCAGHESRHLVYLLAFGCEHDYAHFGAGGPDAAADLEAVDIREHDVQKRDADVRVVAELFESLLAAAGFHRLVAAAAEIYYDEAANVGLILEDKYLFHS